MSASDTKEISNSLPRRQIVVVVHANGQTYELGTAEIWVDDDVTVLRSTEFDLYVESENIDEGVEAFGSGVYQVFSDLVDRVDENQATESDLMTLRLLSERIARIHLAQREEPKRRPRSPKEAKRLLDLGITRSKQPA